jgi:hypothetical protein
MPSGRLKPKSKALLRDLVGQPSKIGFVSLLKELRLLSDSEFEAALAEASRGTATVARQKSAGKKSSRPRDTPVARIAGVLRDLRGFSDSEAQRWLAVALIRDGVDPSLIPRYSPSVHLENWLESLLKAVRSAVVYDVASADLSR